MSLSDHWTLRRGKDLNDYSDRRDFEMVKDDRRREREKRQLLAAFPPIPAQRRPETLRAWLEADLALSGYTLEEALATIKRGRLSDADQPRRDALARGVALLREKDAKLGVIGEAIGRGPQTVANLEARGRELLKADAELKAKREEPRPCRKHERFEPDCPACLRNAPDRATRYGGPEDLRGQLVGGSQ